MHEGRGISFDCFSPNTFSRWLISLEKQAKLGCSNEVLEEVHGWKSFRESFCRVVRLEYRYLKVLRIKLSLQIIINIYIYVFFFISYWYWYLKILWILFMLMHYIQRSFCFNICDEYYDRNKNVCENRDFPLY